MSTDNNTPDEPQDTNLDDFSAEFFGQDTAAPEPTKPDEEVEEVEEDLDATNEEDGTLDEADTLADEDDDNDLEEDEDDGEENADPAPKPKKNRFQERIDELTAGRRAAEREVEELRQRLEAIEQASKKDEPTKTPEAEVDEGPTRPDPNAKNEDGTPKYPLGEYDPQFNVDLTLFTIEQADREREARKAEEAKLSEAEAARAQIEQEWNTQLEAARERYPDFQTKGEQLVSAFEGIDESYGQYLTDTIMQMDNGTDVLYYLAENLDEAASIVQSGPLKATMALGRIQARFEAEAQKPVRKKVSKAPTPPPRNKGLAASRGRVDPATDDLDAFSRDFFRGNN